MHLNRKNSVVHSSISATKVTNLSNKLINAAPWRAVLFRNAALLIVIAAAILLALVYLAPVIAGIGFIAGITGTITATIVTFFPILAAGMAAIIPVALIPIAAIIAIAVLVAISYGSYAVYAKRNEKILKFPIWAFLSNALLMGILVGVSIIFLAPAIVGTTIIFASPLLVVGMFALAPIVVNVVFYLVYAVVAKTIFSNIKIPFWNVLAILSLIEVAAVASVLSLVPVITLIPALIVAGVAVALAAAVGYALYSYSSKGSPNPDVSNEVHHVDSLLVSTTHTHEQKQNKQKALPISEAESPSHKCTR